MGGHVHANVLKSGTVHERYIMFQAEVGRKSRLFD